MNGEAGILQDRVEIAAFERRLGNAQERIRGDQNEQNERNRDPGLHGEHVGLEASRQIVAEQRHQRAEQAEDEDPQQHRALVVTRHAGNLVDERLRGMGVLEHVDDGEIRPHVADRQRGKRDRNEAELHDRGRRGDRHQRGIVLARADDRHAGLHERQSEREYERIVA